MIRGLTWANVGWLAMFFFILVMTVSADGAWQLNWTIATGTFEQLQKGWDRLGESSGSFAKQLDTETQKRYGYDPIEPRAASCATTPTPTGRITMADVVKASQIKNREKAIAVLGQPYCKETTGYEIWLVDTTKVLRIGVDPRTKQLQISMQTFN